MPWRRVLTGALLAGLFLVLLPVLALGLLIVLGIAAVQFLHEMVFELWNDLPRNRRAIDRARTAFADLSRGRSARQWHVARRDRDKCFVQATLTGLATPVTLWLCAVHDASGQVDDLGTWQFHHGVGLRHAVKVYETSRAAGQAWPTDMAELVEKIPAAELPPTARPGLHPHEGSVVVHLAGAIHFFAFAEMVNDGIPPADVDRAEAFDVEARQLHLVRSGTELGTVVQAPFPPHPPSKIFIERMRHHLLHSTSDPDTRERLREMVAAELADHGLMHADDEAIYDGEPE